MEALLEVRRIQLAPQRRLNCQQLRPRLRHLMERMKTYNLQIEFNAWCSYASLTDVSLFHTSVAVH